MGDLLDTADLRHQLLLLLLLLLPHLGRWRRDLHFILFVWGRRRFIVPIRFLWGFLFFRMFQLSLTECRLVLIYYSIHVQCGGCWGHCSITWSWLVPMGFTISLIQSCYALHSFVHSCCLCLSEAVHLSLPSLQFFSLAGGTCLNLFIRTAALWQPESWGFLEFRAAPLIRPFNKLLHLLLSHQII